MDTSGNPSLPALRGKTALVTGGSQHLGSAIARRLAGAGARVVVHYRSNSGGAEETVAAIRDAGGEALALSAELGDPVQVAALIEGTVEAFDTIDILVNNAGSYPTGALLDLDYDDWTRMLRSNIDTAFLCTQHAARNMKTNGGGAIVNIASIAAVSPGPIHSHYNSAKAAVVMLTRSAAQELGEFGIRVNAVSPGVIARPGIREEWPEGVQRWEARAPLQRLGEPGDVADACLFLVSDASRWISGHNLVVDGGMLAASVY